MSDELDEMIDRLKALEDEIEIAFEARRAVFYSEMKEGKARFDAATKASQKALKTGMREFIFGTTLGTILTIPFIYGMIIPFALLDLSLGLYQWTCFSAWRIQRVPRSRYIVIDRHRLSYLNAVQKLNCVFCGYGNGLLAYASEISSRTEQYWCPIKHALRVPGTQPRYMQFVDYGDAEGFKRKSAAFRAALRERKPAEEK